MPLFALLSKRKYFEHFMGTWGEEEGSGRGFIQEKQPPRRILPRKPKGGGQEGSPLSLAKDGSLRGHRSQERRQRTVCAWGKGPCCPLGPPRIMSQDSPLPQSLRASFSAAAAGFAPRAHLRTPSSPTHSHWATFIHSLMPSHTHSLAQAAAFLFIHFLIIH